MKTAYSYNSDGEYHAPVSCFSNPRRTGEFILPAHSTWVVPPEAIEGHTRVFVDGVWDQRVDNRGQTYWLADGTEHAISEIGEELPEAALDAAPDLRTLEDHCAAKRAEVEVQFKKELDKGVEIGGHIYDCDEASQGRMTSAVTLAQTAAAAGLEFNPIDWTLKDNSLHTIVTLEELIQTALAMGAHVQNLFAIRNGHKAEIEKIDSITAVEAYDVTQGWATNG